MEILGGCCATSFLPTDVPTISWSLFRLNRCSSLSPRYNNMANFVNLLTLSLFENLRSVAIANIVPLVTAKYSMSFKKSHT